MDINDIKKWFSGASPIKRRSSVHWIVPSAIGLGIGAALGVGVGMLLAPQSGEDTRKRLLASASNLKEKARTLTERAREQGNRAQRELSSGMNRPHAE